MLSSEAEIRENVRTLYDDVIRTFTSVGSLPHIIRETINKNHGDIFEKLTRKRTALSEELCQVVVSGEISSGKSSLLNFMIGADVLPTSVLESRSVPCRLRYSLKKIANLIDTSGHVVESVQFHDDQEALARLKKIIEGNCEYQDLSYVDIFLNEDTLKGNVVLVDTPGIKEEVDEDNTQLFYHLRKASAFVYIIKTDSAGGTHKLFKIRKRVKELKVEGETELNPDCILYVCNKWDQVDDCEDTRVFEEIRSRLRRHGIEVKEDQLLKLSVRKERKKRQKGKPPSEQYNKFIDKLRRLINLAVKDRYLSECQWLERTLKEILSILDVYHGNMSKTLEERIKTKTEFEDKMSSLKELVEKPKIKYCRDVIEIYRSLSLKLHKHLRAENTCSKIIKECKAEIQRKMAVFKPRTYENVINFSVNLLQEIINEEITEWREKNDVENACAKVKLKVLGSFRSLERNIEQELTDSGESVCSSKSAASWGSAQAPITATDSQSLNMEEEEENRLFTKGEKIGIALSIPLWFPVAITASLFVVPVGIIKVLSNKLSNRNAITQFRENITECLMDILNKLYDLDIFTTDRFFEEFDRNQIHVFNQWIDLQQKAFCKEIDSISAVLQKLVGEVTIHTDENIAIELFLKQVRKFQNECCTIACKNNDDRCISHQKQTSPSK
ncbi:uncharacterized protein in xynA 3'region-like [Saccostrea echinata]|uniref:uncharacterized protein in xynA 3'region-like n=1 Tax=Saccostrea echinata TaxID=191078 RepID=UPI002A80FE9C|nr:uncharacterized protein in xynA 3'region-like [Saccostrea echinata]